MRISVVVSVLAGALLCQAAALNSVAAQGESVAAQAEKDPCQADASRLCKDAIPDEGKIAACLQTNHAKLHSRCAKSLDQRMKNKG
jgi:hypothetical protein